MPRKTISLFVHDLASNPIVRAAPMAKALEAAYDVEVLGLLFGNQEVYEPYRTLFPYKTVRCSLDLPSVMSAIPRLAEMATGDAIYAFKPLLTSLGPALYASGLGRSKPLLLDVEDDEWVPMGTNAREFILRDVVKGWRHATAWKYTRLLHPFTGCSAATTVSTRKLHGRYGGQIIMHGPSEGAFDPERGDFADVDALRIGFNLPIGVKLILFAGVPRPHKGLDLLVQAILRPEGRDWDLVLAGPADNPDVEEAAALLGARCHRVGMQPQERMPALLAAVDAVAVPQRRNRFTESQLPAKLLEAMAMAKAVVGSRVGDLPEIIGTDRGWLFDPEDTRGLAAALADIVSDHGNALRRCANARRWYLTSASRFAIQERLLPLVSAVFTNN